MTGKPPLLEQVRRCLRLKHYSIRTERAYVAWIKRFILFHRKRHPSGVGTDEIRQFLSHLATDGRVAAATQNHLQRNRRSHSTELVDRVKLQ